MFAMPQLRVARRSWCTASMPQVGAEGWDHLDDCPQQDDVHTKLTIGRLGSVEEVLVTAFQARHLCGSVLIFTALSRAIRAVSAAARDRPYQGWLEGGAVMLFTSGALRLST